MGSAYTNGQMARAMKGVSKLTASMGRGLLFIRMEKYPNFNGKMEMSLISNSKAPML